MLYCQPVRLHFSALSACWVPSGSALRFLTLSSPRFPQRPPRLRGKSCCRGLGRRPNALLSTSPSALLGALCLLGTLWLGSQVFDSVFSAFSSASSATPR